MRRYQCSGVASVILLTELNKSDRCTDVPINWRLDEDNDVSKKMTYS